MTVRPLTVLRRLAQSAPNTRRGKMNADTNKKKRQNLSITDKLKLIERVRKGESREGILKETGIGARTLQRFLTTEEDLKKRANTSSPTTKRKRKGKHEDVDEAMEAWFTKIRNSKKVVTGPMLLEQAKKVAEALDIADYNPSNGWLCRWKRRCGIKFKKAHGEKNSADTAAADTFMSNRMPEILMSFDEEDEKSSKSLYGLIGYMAIKCLGQTPAI